MTNLIIACIVSGLASLVLGFIWYSPKVFGNAWMAETGLTPEDAQKGNMPMVMGLTAIICIYMAYNMKWVNHPDEHYHFLLHGMYHGAMNVGIFAVGAIIVNSLFEQKSFRYILINAGYWLVVFAIMGAILASFPSFKKPKTEDTGMRMEQVMDEYVWQSPVQNGDWNADRTDS